VTWCLRTDVSLEEANARLARVDDVLGMVEENGRTTVYLPERRDDLALEGVWEKVAERDWNEAWKTGLTPVTVGAVTIIPPWLPPPADAQVVLVIEPAQAFGTGHHETTTGCLGALQEVPLQGRSVLDVGTGTGVLALAAARLGAARAVAVDIDPIAVDTAASNAQRNDIALDCRLGSVEAAADEIFDVVVANLDTNTLHIVAAGLVAAIAPGGTLIASGVGVERADEAVALLSRAGLPTVARPGHEWVVLIGRRPA
jgi:ribosomal protein L11 methyltransferase